MENMDFMPIVGSFIFRLLTHLSLSDCCTCQRLVDQKLFPSKLNISNNREYLFIYRQQLDSQRGDKFFTMSFFRRQVHEAVAVVIDTYLYFARTFPAAICDHPSFPIGIRCQPPIPPPKVRPHQICGQHQDHHPFHGKCWVIIIILTIFILTIIIRRRAMEKYCCGVALHCQWVQIHCEAFPMPSLPTWQTVVPFLEKRKILFTSNLDKYARIKGKVDPLDNMGQTCFFVPSLRCPPMENALFRFNS